ncbi:MAG TPA: hypothetical protein VIJ96_07450 [Acidothermaceae bacterium]|jgi:hypothetical protein
MGEYRRGESRSGSSQLGLLVEQEDDERIQFHGPKCDGTICEHVSPCDSHVEQFVCRAK